jgi:chemotaxis protein histidine kinase CheA
METELGSLRAEIQHDACPEPVVVLQRLHDGLAQMSAAVQGARSMLVEASPIGEAILDQVTVRNRDLVALDQACVHVGRETRDVVDRLLAQPFGDLIVCMPAATQRWSEKLSKQVALEVEGRHVPVPRNLVQVLPAAIAQLVRNAVSHGIESPTQRLSSGKPEVGLIQLQCRETATDIEVHVIDDGCGLDEHRLNAARDVSGAARLGAVDTAFISGVSTADDATIRSGVAGCGVGLSAVRAELAQLGYCIELQTEAGRGVHVRLYRNDTAQRESSA